MAWQNHAAGFGLISRALHWATAALILAQIALGLGIARMQPDLSTLWLFGLHKSLGFTVLFVTLLRLVWHRISPVPQPLGAARSLPNRAARAVHAALYLCLVLIPLTGWIASSASGLEVVIFAHLTLPAIAPVSAAWETAGFALHAALVAAMAALLAVHIAGALLRAAKGDGTLSRMLRG